MQEENANAPSDIKDMQKILIDKSPIGTSIPVKFDKFNFKKYNIINPTSTTKRVGNSCTVRYYSQSYLYDEISQKFEQCDKNYKNIKKDKISNMSQEKRWIRYCLLLMQEEEQSLFEISEDILENFYKEQVDKLIQDKKRQKEKELKEIEREKIKEKKAKEIEELKKKGEYQEGVIPSTSPQQPEEKQKIEIDMNIVNNVPNNYKFDGKIYYRIYVEDVFFEKPPFPNTARELNKYVKEFNVEIKRILSKVGKRKNDKDNKNLEVFLYNMAESWCNEIISKIINMGKGKLKNEFLSKKFEKERQSIENEMKKPLLNLMLIYSKKAENNAQIIRQGINLVENTYYKRFKGQYDLSYVKITGRYIMFLIKTNDFSKAKKVIEELKNKCKDVKEADELLKDLEPRLELAEKKKKNENILISKGKIKAASDDTKPDYDWQQGQNEDELNEALKKDAELVKGNMDLINSNL